MKTFELSYEDLGRICSRLTAASDGKRNVFDIIRTLKPNGMTDEDWAASPLARILAFHLLRFAVNHTDSMPWLLSLEMGLSETAETDTSLLRITVERQSDGQWHVCEYDGTDQWKPFVSTMPFVSPTPDRSEAYANYACAVDEWLSRIRHKVITE